MATFKQAVQPSIHSNVSRDLNRFDDKTKSWEMKYLDNFKNGISSSNAATANILKTKWGIKPEFDQEAYLKNMQDQVNSMYDKQRDAQLGAYRAKRDHAVGQINQQKAELKPMYADKRNQADVVNAQNVSRLRELMAANGLTKSGENVTSQVALGSARQGALNQLNTQEQQQVNDFDRRIADYMNPAEEQAMMAQLEAQRSQALYEAMQRADDTAYSRGRDSLADQRYADETRYSRGRDAVGDERYTDERDYSRGRDTVADNRYNTEWKYNTGRDSVMDKRYLDEWLYQKQRDALADQWRQKEWDRNILESDRSFNRRGSGGGGGGGGGSYGGYYASPSVNSQPAAQISETDLNRALMQQYNKLFKIQNPGTVQPNLGSTAYYNKMRGLFG